MTPTYLRQQAQHFINDINRALPPFNTIDWSLSIDALIPIVATACRASIIPVCIKPVPEKLSPRIARPNETAPELIRRCLDGYWKSVGHEFHFPNGLDYCSSPDSSLNTRGVEFGEWTWQVNRHHEWLWAAQYYNQTQDDSAANAVSRWLRSWLEQCPCPNEDLNAQQGPWRTIEIGIRMGSMWPQILSAFYKHPAFDDELLLAWLQCYAEQAAFVYQYRKQNNWLLMEMNGLIHAGVQVPMHKDSALWRQQAQDALVVETSTQFNNDGMQRELSASYHVVCFSNYMRAVDILRIGQHQVDQRLETCIRNMLKPCRALARANGRMFDFQDSHAINLNQLLKQVPNDWLEDGDTWFLDQQGKPPKQLHHLLENAGYAILRSGYQDDDTCVAFDGGPFGDAHQHEDKLSIQIHAYGKDLIGEAGIVDYNDSPERSYSLSTLAHSTAIVDGLGQNRGASYQRNQTPLDAIAEISHDFEADVPWAEAIYNEGYGPQQAQDIQHQRRVSMLANEHIQIIDTFTSRDQLPHTIELLFHSMKDNAELHDNMFHTNGAGANVRLEWEANNTEVTPSVCCGGTEPDLRGWGAPDDYSKGFYAVVPRPCLTLTFVVTDQTQVITDIHILKPA